MIIVIYANRYFHYFSFFVKPYYMSPRNDLFVSLGQRIKSIRIKKNMTQNQLAIQCDIEKANMSRIESGQANPTVRTLYKISGALNVPMVELFKD